MPPDQPTKFREVYQLLAGAGIEFIVVGGCAANLLGSAQFTRDMDVVYRRSEENMRRLVETLAPYSPYLRGAPPGLPFTFDLRTLRSGLNFTLTTTLGALDLIGEIAGGGKYEELLPFAESTEFDGIKLCCVTLEQLIHLKRAAGRPRDFDMIAQLEALRQEKRKLERERSE